LNLEEELHNLYFSPNIIRLIKSRRIRWAGHVAHMGEMRNVYKILVENLKGDPNVDRKIILQRTSEKQGVKIWTGFIQLRISNRCL
jgi:hypothetical protein